MSTPEPELYALSARAGALRPEPKPVTSTPSQEAMLSAVPPAVAAALKSPAATMRPLYDAMAYARAVGITPPNHEVLFQTARLPAGTCVGFPAESNSPPTTSVLS